MHAGKGLSRKRQGHFTELEDPKVVHFPMPAGVWRHIGQHNVCHSFWEPGHDLDGVVCQMVQARRKT